MLTVIIFLIVLAVLIFVHELGHFLFAKMFGIRVDAFKIGFGPKIFSWTPNKKDGTKGETEYGLNLIPFGGYVKIFGENPDDTSTHGPEAKKRSMVHKPRWQQAIVLVGGVLFNFLFATIIYIGLLSHGMVTAPDNFPGYSQYLSNPRIMITGLTDGLPAQKAGLKDGDVIVSVYKSASSESATSTIQGIQQVINANNGSEVVVNYIRGGHANLVHVLPTLGIAVSTTTLDNMAQKYFIGIQMADAVDIKLPFFTAVYEGGVFSTEILKITAVGLYDFIGQAFHGKADLSQVTGPVGIAKDVGDAFSVGIGSLLSLTALISINLAIINLLPFPALDGGRVFFLAIEAVIRRRLPANITNWVNVVGFGLLMLLMVVITYREVATEIMKHFAK